MVPLLKCREILVLMGAIISIFLGKLVACRVFLLKFHISQAVFHRFLISEDTHITPDIFAPSDCR